MSNTTPLFPLGTIVATRNVLDRIALLDILAALDRHAAGDWGEIDEQDRVANDRALREGERLLSVYSDGSGCKFWIVSEATRETTTVLMPEDY